MDRQFFDLFTQEVLIEAGLNDIPEDFKKDYIQQLSYELRRRVGIMAVRSLDALSFHDFRERIKDNPSQDLLCVIDFFKERLPQFNEIVAEVFFDFKCQILEQASLIKTMVNMSNTENQNQIYNINIF